MRCTVGATRLQPTYSRDNFAWSALKVGLARTIPSVRRTRRTGATRPDKIDDVFWYNLRFGIYAMTALPICLT